MLRLILFFTLLLSNSVCFAQQAYYYETFVGDKTVPISNFTITIGDLKDGKRTVQWQEEEAGVQRHEEYVLDENWATLKWHVNDVEKKTDYEGVRKGKHLILKGKFEGRRLDKRIPIGREPFYFNPKLGLRSLALSTDRKKDFWAIRHDTLSEYKMAARKKKREKIDVAGQTFEADQIYWYAKIDVARLFKRTYWYRASDGMYIKQEGSSNQTRVFVKEL